MNRFTLVGILTLGGMGCGSSAVTTVCTLELRGVFSPADTTISVGQHFPASLTILTCGGGAVVRDTVTWKSVDSSVVTVDALTGVVTAVGVGRASLLAMTHSSGTFEGSNIVVH